MSIPTWVIVIASVVLAAWALIVWDDAKRSKREERERELEVARRFVASMNTASKVVDHTDPVIQAPASPSRRTANRGLP